MTQSQLIEHISAFNEPIRAAHLRSEVKARRFTLPELVDLTFFPDKNIAVKASRLLQTMLVKFPENYCEEMDYLVKRAAEVDDANCKMHYARIIMHITSPDVSKEVRAKAREINFERVVELCFEWMSDPNMLVRVRASSAEALFNLRHRYPWIAEELSRRLESMLPDAAPMLAARADMILSYLHCED